MTWKTSDKALELFITQIICTILVSAAGCLRLWAQCVRKKKDEDEGTHAAHDKLMYTSVLLYTAQAVVILLGIVEGGIGQRAADLNELQAVKGFKAWYFGELIYAALSCFVKTSVILYLRQVYYGSRHGPVINRPFLRIGLNTSLLCVWLASVVFFFAAIFQCSPVGYYWGQVARPTGSGTCYRSIVPITGIVLSIVLAVTDLLLALIPVLSLWKTQLPWKTKAKIQVLSSLGVLAGAAMIARVPYIKILEHPEDFLYETVDVAKWTIIEAALGILAGCLPTIWPLLKRTRPERMLPDTNLVRDMTSNHQVSIGRSRARTAPVNLVNPVKSVVVDSDFTLSESSRNNTNGFGIQYQRDPWV